MSKIDICCGEYGAKWGLTDFYEKSEEIFRSAIASGADFEINYGCRKEIRYAEIVRDENGVSVSVTSCMDDLFEEDDLIYDALWKRCKVEEELPDDMVDEIRTLASELWLSDESTATRELHRSATFEEIVSAIGELEDETENSNSEMFKTLCDLVEEIYTSARK